MSAREHIAMIEPRRALVRPRVLSPLTGEALLLEEVVLDAIRQAPGAPIQIVGGAGAGKTTALHHLQAVLTEDSTHFQTDLVLLDEPDCQEQIAVHFPKTVVFTTEIAGFGDGHWLTLDLAPWSDDDLVEYLLAKHKARCGEILADLRQQGGTALLQGVPELCTITLDALAERRAHLPLGVALRALFLEMLSGADTRDSAEQYAVACVARDVEASAPALLRDLRRADSSPTIARLLRHRPLLEALATSRIAKDLSRGRPCGYLKTPLPRYVVCAVAEHIRTDAAAQAHARQFLTRDDPGPQPMAASICHQLDRQWLRSFPTKVKSLIAKWLPMLPLKEESRRLNLCGAYLERAEWPGIDMSEIDFSSADLSFGDFSEASLQQAITLGTSFRSANLTKAMLGCLFGVQADFANADLRQANAAQAKFGGASFQGAMLDGATFTRAECQEANFTGASLVKASFQDADLNGAVMTDADWTDADLSRAKLIRNDLRMARLDGTVWHGATAVEANFEDVSACRVDFEGAFLKGSLWTGSTLEGANFLMADLRDAGLANIEWEGADLRNADLRGASFHLGSSRSGLVGSPIAREGSMTGFYTDESTEQEFKAPEEIRKANLRGADLRDANIDSVDFYLVDLRDALYDADQLAHFRACRAILRNATVD